MTLYKIERQDGLGKPWETIREGQSQEAARDVLSGMADLAGAEGRYYPQWMSAAVGSGASRITYRATPEE